MGYGIKVPFQPAFLTHFCREAGEMPVSVGF